MKAFLKQARHLPTILVLAVVPCTGGAQSVMLDANGTFGQGVMRPRGISECLVVAPLHVVQNVTPIQVIADGGARMEFTLQQPHEDADLAILTTRTTPQSRCMPWRVPSDLSALLEDPSNAAVLRSRENDGSLSFTPVWIRSVTSRHVTVTPRESGRFQSGMSGSQLLVNGQFAGMLQRVQPDSGIGYAIRIDVIERVIGGFLTGPRNEDPDFSPPPLAVPSNEINLWIRRYESVILGDQHTSFGVKEYSGLGYPLQIQMNTDWHYMHPGQRMPFPDSRGECHVIYMRTDDPTPTPDRHGDERHGFAVVCNRKQEQQNGQGGILRRRITSVRL